eukprot:SAG11_NODE_2832_length_2926_cov_4.607496_1_plen_204_part_00
MARLAEEREELRASMDKAWLEKKDKLTVGRKGLEATANDIASLRGRLASAVKPIGSDIDETERMRRDNVAQRRWRKGAAKVRAINALAEKEGGKGGGGLSEQNYKAARTAFDGNASVAAAAAEVVEAASRAEALAAMERGIEEEQTALALIVAEKEAQSSAISSSGDDRGDGGLEAKAKAKALPGWGRLRADFLRSELEIGKT